MSPTPTRPTLNKDQEIVIRLNNAEQKATLKDVSTDVIFKDLNTRIEMMGYRPLKRLPSGDLAALTVNNEEAEKLRSNTRWTDILGGNARILNRTYGILINGVRVADFDGQERTSY